MEFKSFMEALKGKQHKIDKNKNNKIDAQDFEILRKEETELAEATVKTQKYSWGTMKTIHHGADFSIPLHPEHHQAIAKLKDEQEHKFKTEDGKSWTARRKGDEVHFQGDNGGNSTKVKHDSLKESEDRMARSDYRVSPSGRKSHKEIVFNHGEEDKEEKEKEKAGLQEKAPPGFEGTVKAMKKKKEIDNPYALAWSMYKKGYKSHKKADGTMKEEEQIEERNKQNALMRKTMDASRGARYKLNNPVPPADPKHKTARDHNVAIGRALRNEDTEQVEEGYYEKPASAYRRKGDEIGGGSSKNDVPFEGPYTKVKGDVKDKSGATHTPMSRAKHLAKMAMKKQMKEDIDRLFEAKEKTEYDYEGDMARGQLQSIANNAQKVHDMLKDNDNLPEWVQSKITLAEDYISTVANYMMSEIDEQAPVAPVPGMKFKNQAVMVHPETKSRVVINRKNIDNYTKDGYKEVSPGQKLKEDEEVKFSYQEFAMMLEYEPKDGRYIHKGTYGGSYVDPEGADDADDKKPKQQPAAKRGRGRPAGAKSGARKITGTSKLFK